jgi:geranylgeranyl pyrophosphate synthase
MDDDGGGNNLFAAEQASLREALRAWLAQVQDSYAWGADAGILLAAPGKLLTAAPTSSIRIPAGFWALLPMSVASYCSSSLGEDAPRIHRLAVACELLLCALDYYDEIEDSDSSSVRSELGDGRLLNCASAIYQEGLQVLAELDSSWTSTPPLRLMSIASEELRLAMSGQHLDLIAEQLPWDGFTPEKSIAIAEAKAGTLCRMVCRLACTLVGASDQLTVLFAHIGTHIGIAAQIENDIHDLERELSAAGSPDPGKNDLARSKKTFPLVLLQHSLQQLATSADTHVYEGQEPGLRMLVFRNVLQQVLGGAIAHRFTAASLVETIEQLRGTAFPLKLRLILGIDIEAR